ILDSNGRIFGTTPSGGSQWRGLVFQFDLATSSLSTVAEFSSSTAGSRVGVTMDCSGNLYGGMAAIPRSATVYEILAGSHTITTVKAFGSQDFVNSGVVLDAAGNIYCTKSGNGVSTLGGVLKVAAGTRALSTVANFSSATGGNAEGGVIVD